MKNFSVSSLIVLLVLLLLGTTNATTLTFDDVAGTLDPQPVSLRTAVPDGYGGFNWTGTWSDVLQKVTFVSKTYADENGFSSAGITGKWAAYIPSNFVSVPIYATNGVLFNFKSATFASFVDIAWNTISITGYRNGDLIYSGDLTAYPNEATTFQPEDPWTNIDAIVMKPNQAHVTMDQFTFSRNIAPVPEPATILLLASGLLGIGACARKGRKN